MNKKLHVLIPARGGSRGIPFKNLEVVAGKSLVERAINYAKLMSDINSVSVSSDSVEILEIAIQHNVHVHKRSQKNSSDESSANDVVSEYIEWAKKDITNFDQDSIIIYLQPTSPFRSIQNLEKAAKLYCQTSTPVISVKLVTDHPSKMLKMSSSGQLNGSETLSLPIANRQELPDLFIATGSFYIFSVSDFEKNHTIPVISGQGFVEYGNLTLDIDSSFDLHIAQKLGETIEF